MSDEGWGFADIYSMESSEKTSSGTLEDVSGDDWRNILVLGRATKEGVFPETLALVGRARHLADELGCRVEVLLIGDDLEPATEVLKRYPINTIYQVNTDDYAPIDKTARILEQVVRKRRPELIMVFQSRTGDAVTAYAANRLGVGFALGAHRIDIDTMERRARVSLSSWDGRFTVAAELQHYPQFVSVQRGLFRAPMEDPYASVQIHALEVDPGKVADVKVLEKRPPPEPSLADAQRVVIAGSRIKDTDQFAKVTELAARLDAVVGISRDLLLRGIGSPDQTVGKAAQVIQPQLLVTVGARGSLDLWDGIAGDPLVCAIGCDEDDPIADKAAYRVLGNVEEALIQVLGAI